MFYREYFLSNISILNTKYVGADSWKGENLRWEATSGWELDCVMFIMLWICSHYKRSVTVLLNRVCTYNYCSDCLMLLFHTWHVMVTSQREMHNHVFWLCLHTLLLDPGFLHNVVWRTSVVRTARLFTSCQLHGNVNFAANLWDKSAFSSFMPFLCVIYTTA